MPQIGGNVHADERETDVVIRTKRCILNDLIYWFLAKEGDSFLLSEYLKDTNTMMFILRWLNKQNQIIST